MSDPVAAVTEAEATGEIAAIFADIRAVYRVGAVNLIWRHLATIPGALPWAWRVVRPLYVDGTIGREAIGFKAGLNNPALPPVPDDVFAAAGLSSDDLRQIRGILTAYDRTNSMALIALTALTAWRDRGGQFPHSATSVEAEETSDLPLPALTPLEAMPPHLAALVRRLNRFGTKREQPILASMYRHLSHWPAYLGLAWTALAPIEASGALQAAITAASGQARIRAGAIAMEDDPPPLAIRDAIEQAIEPFTSDVLAKMVVICGMLRAMTSHQEA
jgi:hypothetical protein